MINKSTRVW